MDSTILDAKDMSKIKWQHPDKSPYKCCQALNVRILQTLNANKIVFITRYNNMGNKAVRVSGCRSFTYALLFLELLQPGNTQLLVRK